MNENMKIFDGHNDVLFRLFLKDKESVHEDFLKGDNEGHLDFPRIKEAGFIGGFFAIYVPSQEEKIKSADKPIRYDDMENDSYELPLPKPVDVSLALPIVLQKIDILKNIEKQSKGEIKICKNAKDLNESILNKKLSVIMHIEGAEAIGSDLENLDTLYDLGLRSIGPVWSRPTLFAHGVPFKFPSSPDTGEGLTEIGKQLIKECNKRKIIIDLSHLNEKGFWDIEKLSQSPLIATHSNAHSICTHTRNLTDKQLSAIKDSGGMVGVNFAPAFLRTDGKMLADTDLDIILRHFNYLIEKLGDDKVGFGSDFDGALIPSGINDVLGLNKLRLLMKNHGFNDQLMKKLCHDNWVNVISKILG
ncbi:MAG: peptidase [Pelagibacteraceae bacterium]|nr:peptidase [Pelagibacteraceae bacterium]